MICDDYSADSTVALLRRVAVTMLFAVHVIQNPQTLGYSRISKAIGLCAGDIVALADQNEVWYPEKLQQLEVVFKNRPKVKACSQTGWPRHQVSAGRMYAVAELSLQP